MPQDPESIRRVVGHLNAIKSICAPLCPPQNSLVAPLAVAQHQESSRRVVQNAEALRLLHTPPDPPHEFNSMATTLPRAPSLLPPQSIRSKIAPLGLNGRLVDRFVKKYDRTCKDIHAAAQSALEQAYRDFAAIPDHSAATPMSQFSSRIFSAYKTQYTRSLQALEQRAIGVATKIAERKGTLKDDKAKAAKKRLPFNSDFVPTLEQQFDLNPYPTVADRATLAKQSGMTDRQIEIWFQNRRRRCKEAGLPVRRVSSTNSISSTDTEATSLNLTPPPVQQSPVIDIEVASTFDDCDYADSNEYEDNVDEEEDDGPEIIDLTITPDPEPIPSPVAIPTPPNPLELPDSQGAPAPYKPRYSLCPPFAGPSADDAASSLILPVGPFSFPSPTPYWPRQPSSCISPAQTTTPMPPPTFASTMDALSTVFASLHVTPLSSSRSPSSTSSRTLSSSSSPSSPKPCTPRAVSTSTASTASVTGASTSNATPRPYRPRPRVRPPVTIPVSGPVPTPTTASTNEKTKKKKVSGPPRRVPANQRTSSASGVAGVNPMNLRIDAGNRDQGRGAPSRSRTLSSSSSSSSTSTFSSPSRTTSSSSSSSTSSTSTPPSNLRFAPMPTAPLPSAPLTQPSSFFSSSFSSFSFSSPSGSVGSTTSPSDSQSHFNFPFSFAL